MLQPRLAGPRARGPRARARALPPACAPARRPAGPRPCAPQFRGMAAPEQQRGGGTDPREEEPEMNPQQVNAAFQQIEKECSVLINKIAELQQEVNEHGLVQKAFEKVEPTRRCFRMVGGVLVERTVAEVRPAVAANQEKIKQAIEGLEKQLKAKSEKRAQFSEKYGLNRQGGANQGGDAAAPAHESTGAKGGGPSVLV